MTTFKEFITEKTKINGGNGYLEMFVTHSSTYDKFIKEVKDYIKRNEGGAEEGYSMQEQKELIIDDIVAGLYKDLGGK